MCGVLGLTGCGKSGSSEGKDGAMVGSTGTASTATTGQAVQEKLKADKDLAGADIKAQEQSGTIVLDGTVKSVAQKDKAEADVIALQKEKKLQTGVLNNLTISEGGAKAGDTKMGGDTSGGSK